MYEKLTQIDIPQYSVAPSLNGVENYSSRVYGNTQNNTVFGLVLSLTSFLELHTKSGHSLNMGSQYKNVLLIFHHMKKAMLWFNLRNTAVELLVGWWGQLGVLTTSRLS